MKPRKTPPRCPDTIDLEDYLKKLPEPTPLERSTRTQPEEHRPPPEPEGAASRICLWTILMEGWSLKLIAEIASRQPRQIAARPVSLLKQPQEMALLDEETSRP
jgi:hypothetical protein